MCYFARLFHVPESVTAPRDAEDSMACFIAEDNYFGYRVARLFPGSLTFFKFFIRYAMEISCILSMKMISPVRRCSTGSTIRASGAIQQPDHTTSEQAIRQEGHLCLLDLTSTIIEEGDSIFRHTSGLSPLVQRGNEQRQRRAINDFSSDKTVL